MKKVLIFALIALACLSCLSLTALAADTTAAVTNADGTVAKTPTFIEQYGFLILMAVVLIGMFWFTSRSQKKQEKAAQDMRDSIAVGDEVTTIGGIIGMVVSVKGETCMIETGKDKTKFRILKSAIRSVDVKAADKEQQEEA